MGWAVFANSDRVMGKDVNIGKLRQGAQPNGGAAIIGEDHKRCARCAEQSVIRDAIQNRAHPMFANAEPKVAAAGIVAREIATVLNVVHCRSVQIGAAAHEQRHCFRDRLQYFAAGFSSGEFRVRRKLGDFG